MRGERISDSPVRTKAVLVDPASMRIVWMNESASANFSDDVAAGPIGAQIGHVVPALPGTPADEIVRAVAARGVPQHVRADVVSTGKGSLSMVTSLYPMPDGTVLVLSENTWLLDKEPSTDKRGSRARRR